MRDRLYAYALSTFPTDMAAALVAPVPVRNPESGEEADAEPSDNTPSPRTDRSFGSDNPTPSCGSDVTPVLSISSTSSLQAGANTETEPEPTNQTGQLVLAAQQEVTPEKAPLGDSIPSIKTRKLPIAENTQRKFLCLSPCSKFLKRQRISRRRAVLADDALHTESTETFVRRRPHLSRTDAIKAMRKHRLDKWLEQQDRPSSTSSVRSVSPVPSSTATWTPVPGFPPSPSAPADELTCNILAIQPRALHFEPEDASQQTILYPPLASSVHASSDAFPPFTSQSDPGQITLQQQENTCPTCAGGMRNTFCSPSFDDGAFFSGPPDPFSALLARRNFLVFCFSEAGFLGNKTLALKQPVRASMSQLARGWRYSPKTMVLVFTSLSIAMAANNIADQGCRPPPLLSSCCPSWHPCPVFPSD